MQCDHRYWYQSNRVRHQSAYVESLGEVWCGAVRCGEVRYVSCSYQFGLTSPGRVQYGCCGAMYVYSLFNLIRPNNENFRSVTYMRGLSSSVHMRTNNTIFIGVNYIFNHPCNRCLLCCWRHCWLLLLPLHCWRLLPTFKTLSPNRILENDERIIMLFHDD